MVDYNSLPSLESALDGQDALVCALAYDAINIQRNLIDAAVNAGVRRIIPSEYGNDIRIPHIATIPIYQPKLAIHKYLDQKVAVTSSFSYTMIESSSFLAAGYALNFLVDVDHRKCNIKDGGDVPFSAATMEDIAQAAISILVNLNETANRPVKIKSVDTTQNDILAIAQRAEPAAEWDITYAMTEDLEKEARESWETGDHSEPVVEKFIWRAFLTGGGYFKETDNKLLGIRGLDKAGLEELVKAAVLARKV